MTIRSNAQARDRLDVVFGEGDEETLLAGAAHVVAGVLLAVVEEAEVDAGGAEDACERGATRAGSGGRASA